MKKIIGLALLLTCLSAAPAMALESGWASADYVHARLLAGNRDQGTIKAGLEIRLDEGWHAFWRMPGDGGLPPRLEWGGSANVAKVDVEWPLPERFDTAGLYSFGYQGTVLLPLTVEAREGGAPVTLGLKAEIMVCRDICVPQKIAVSLFVPAEVPESAADAGKIDDAQAAVPAKGDQPRLKIENVVIGPEAIVITAFSAAGFDDADLFIESGDLYISAIPEIAADKDDRRKAMIRIAAPEGVENLAKELGDTDITLTLTNGREAIEKTITF